MIFIIFFSLVFINTFALWKYVRLKHDVYEYTEKLDNTINYMLKNGELKTTPYENDDLWEKIYEKLVRLSHLYTHKNLEEPTMGVDHKDRRMIRDILSRVGN